MSVNPQAVRAAWEDGVLGVLRLAVDRSRLPSAAEPLINERHRELRATAGSRPQTIAWRLLKVVLEQQLDQEGSSYQGMVHLWDGK